MLALSGLAVWVVAGGMLWSLPQPFYSVCHVPVGLSGNSLHEWSMVDHQDHHQEGDKGSSKFNSSDATPRSPQE